MDDEVQEFDCVECGRHIIVLCGPPTDRCALCQSLPGWYNNPELVKILDPERA